MTRRNVRLFCSSWRISGRMVRRLRRICPDQQPGFSRETFRKQRLQAPISVTPEHHRKADRQMLVDAISPSHSPTLSHIPVDGQTRSYSVLEHPPREAQALEVVSEIGMLRQSTLGADEATALVITDTQQAGLQPPKCAFAP